jgi:hypothetical protein
LETSLVSLGEYADGQDIGSFSRSVHIDRSVKENGLMSNVVAVRISIMGMNIRGRILATGEIKYMIDDLLLQEIFSLREKLKIAIHYIKFYDPTFDEREFIHQVGSVEYDQWIEELTEGESK